MTVRFDEHDPASEKSKPEARASVDGLDYSPLPLLSLRSLAMGVLVSMGGLM